MSTVLYILVALLVFGVLIAVHELGHFLAAKACGVKVNEFSIGMGPAIFKKQKGETLYALRCLPFGGFCAMEGEDETSEDPRALENQGFWAKLLIFAAGAAMNFLTGLLIILCLYGGAKAFVTPVIADFAQGCPLEGTLLAGDKVTAIDGERIYVYSDVSLLLNLKQSGSHDLTVLRNGEKVELTNVPMELREYTDKNGNAYTGYGLTFSVKEAGIGDRISYSFANAIDFVRMVRLSLQMLVTGQAGVKDISGAGGHRLRYYRCGAEQQLGLRSRAEHCVSGGHDRRKPGGDEPAAPAGAGRGENLLPGHQRPVHAGDPQAHPAEV